MRRTREKLQERFARLRDFDRDCDADALRDGLLVGIDEAGVGPLAGPVVAAAVILPEDFDLPELYDSKQLNLRERQLCESVIRKRALGIGVARVSAKRIDCINILNAMLQAHERAMQQLDVSPRTVLVDGHRAPQMPAQWKEARLRTIVRGDSTSMSIAAASIIAKASRDRTLQRLDRRYPGYGFADHKGYGTPAHKAAVRKLGLSPVHRKSFCGWLEDERLLELQMQLTLE